ncbi:MAG: GldG family protein [Anaerolineae bacterium]|jgi:ABC-type uncharacterized transport system involved in gliding motility auxiliary subunit
MMRDIQRFLKEYGFILGPASLAALAAFVIRKIVWLARWDAITFGLLFGGILLGALFILGNPEQVQSVLTKRGTRYGFNAAVMSIAFIAILGGLNYLVIQFLDQRIDVTELKKHTLSPQSKQVLAEVNREVNIVGFFTAEEYALREDFEEMLDQYLAESNYLNYIVIDPDQDPVGARIQGDPPYEGLLFKSETRTARVQYSPSEQEITNALLKVTSDKQKAIYFLQGHGERDIANSAEDGYSVVAEKLRDQNYKVETLNLVISDTIPSDAAVIVIATTDPQGKLLDEELTRLQTYLNGGGRALIMQDPFSEAGLNIILSNWQVRFGEGVVVDEVWAWQSTLWPVGVKYGYSPITADLQRQRINTLFPLARPIEQTGDPLAGVAFTDLIETSERSWAETGAEVFLDDADTAGPLSLMASIESGPMFSGATASSSKTRIVLVGDTDFATNEFVREVAANEQLFLNAVNWLAEEERLIAIGPKDAGPSYIFITDIQKNVIVFLAIFVIPLMIGATGIAVWVMRRIRSKFQV